MSQISVIICTHNPRQDYLERTLAALKEQSLAKTQWELLLIDNASKEKLQEKWELSWHPQARHIREEQLGLTHARLRGIAEAMAELIVFVDDDNVLAPNYLADAAVIGQQFPFLGAWGGSAEAVYDIPPPPWIGKYAYLMAVREVTRDQWSNLVETDVTLPWGAGMCVRKVVAVTYANKVKGSPARSGLGRVGQSLGCSEDVDLASTALDMGMGTGLFSRLILKHLIPSGRLSEQYLIRLMKGNQYSNIVLNWCRGRPPQIAQHSAVRSLLGRVRRFFSMSARERRFFEAAREGRQQAIRDIQNWERS
jgi:glycosyltransferase involved in cell wall biosynthesis